MEDQVFGIVRLGDAGEEVAKIMQPNVNMVEQIRLLYEALVRERAAWKEYVKDLQAFHHDPSYDNSYAMCQSAKDLSLLTGECVTIQVQGSKP